MKVSHTKNGQLVVIDSPNYPKMGTPINAYIGLIERWDATSMGSVEQVKTLAFDSKDKVICEISFDIKKETLMDNLNQAFDEVLNRKADKVMIVQNNPYKSIVPDARVKNKLRSFWETALQKGLTVEDTMLVTDNSFYSLKESKADINA